MSAITKRHDIIKKIEELGYPEEDIHAFIALIWNFLQVHLEECHPDYMRARKR